MRAVNSHRMERWLGKERCAALSANMHGRGWYGTPIAVGAVPGAVYLDKHGDFVGKLDAGSEGCLEQACEDIALTNRVRRMGWARKQGGGFGTLAALDSAVFQYATFSVNGSVAVAGAGESLFKVSGGQGFGGAAASAAPGGTVPTNATTGALPFNNSPSGTTTHFVNAWMGIGSSPGSLLLYDRIFAVAKTMNSTTTEAVTGVPSRYQTTTSGTVGSAENNFVFPEVGATALAATAHNWTVCQYTNQAGTASQTIPSVAGVSGAGIARVDLPALQWFMPLAAGDTGIKALTQMQCSALVATGLLDFVIGHPIAFMPSFLGSHMHVANGVNSALNLARIFDNACLSVIGLPQAAASVTFRGGYTLANG